MSDLYTTETMNLTAEILRTQMHPHHEALANEQLSNNHINLAFEEVEPKFRDPLVQGLGGLVLEKRLPLAFIAPVPNGATGWAEALIKKYNLASEVIILSKLEKRSFEVTARSKRQAEWMVGQAGIVLDDVTTDGGTSEVYANLLRAELGLDVAAIVSLFYRGVKAPKSRYQRHAVIQKSVPLNLDWEAFRRNGTLQSLSKA